MLLDIPTCFQVAVNRSIVQKTMTEPFMVQVQERFA